MCSFRGFDYRYIRLMGLTESTVTSAAGTGSCRRGLSPQPQVPAAAAGVCHLCVKWVES